MKLSEIRNLPLTLEQYNSMKEGLKTHVIDKTDFRSYCKEYIKAIMNDQIAKKPERAIMVLNCGWDGLPAFLQNGVTKHTYEYKFIRMRENKSKLKQRQTAAARLLQFRVDNDLSRDKCCEIVNTYSTIYGVTLKVKDLENYECLNQSPKIDKSTAFENGFDIDISKFCGYHGKYVSATVNSRKNDPDYSISFEEEKKKEPRPYEMPPSVEAWFQKWGL